MKLIDKIKEYQDLDGLISEIKSDKNTHDILSRRYPARLIFLQKFETFRLLIERLALINIDIYHIEKDLPKPDGWITKDSLIDILLNIIKDTAIVPFSEIVRFYSESDFKNFFNQLLLIENSSDLSKRIYLPLIGIEERFEKEFFQSFSRKEESAPFWKISKETPNSVKVFLYINDTIGNIGDYEVIPNAEEWLKFWKKKSPCDVICYAKPLNLFYKNTLPDTIFTIEQFNNPKNLVEKIFNKEIPIQFVDNEIKYWEKLTGLVSINYTTFIDFVKKYFKITTLNIYDILDVWLKTEDSFNKWLLKHYILSQKCLEQKYIYYVFSSLTDYSDHTLLKTLYQKIFSTEINQDSINDRLKLIAQFSKHKPILLCDELVFEFNNQIRALTDYNLALSLTTGFFSFEKVYIFELIADKKIFDSEILAQRFPDITNYLSTNTFDEVEKEHEWIYEYLTEYKKSKLTDIITDRLSALVTNFNREEKSFYNWYHSFRSIHSIIHTNKVDKLIWIDAIGIEWVAFIENYLNQNKKELTFLKKLVGVANLPTSTEHNRFEDSKHIQDFDLFIHSNPYSYPVSIINEFNEIKRIIDTHLSLDSDQTIGIVSDHGLSALSRLVDSKKYGKEDSHEGRFIEVKGKDYVQDSDYLFHKSEVDNKQYLIALKHNSLGKKPIREVHGGCTPEEVLVPLIIISNKQDFSNVEYSIFFDKTKISKKEPFISLDITPKPISAHFEIAGKTKKLNYNNSTNKWEAIIDKSLSGKIFIKIIVGKTEKSFTINIISGIIEEDLF